MLSIGAKVTTIERTIERMILGKGNSNVRSWEEERVALGIKNPLKKNSSKEKKGYT